MKRLILGLFLIIVFSLGCTQPVDKIDAPIWDNLTIFSERFTKISIENNTDSSVVNFYHRGSFFAPLPKDTKMKIDTIKVFFTEAEKDTIYSLVNDLIIHPIETKKHCTEFIGHIELNVNYGSFEQSGEYSSICDWTTLSDKTKHLHNILKRRVKKIYLGENSNLR